MSVNVIGALFSLLFFLSCGKKSEVSSDSLSYNSGEVAEVASVDTEDKSDDAENEYKYKDSKNSEGEHSADWFNSINVLGMGSINIHCYYPFKYEERNTNEGEIEQLNYLALYNDKECTDLYVEYKFMTGMVPAGMNITPLYNAVDYDYYCFVTTSQNEISYEVALNESDRKYVKIEKHIEFKDWEKFFTDIFYINPTEDNPFRTEPNENAEIVELEFEPDTEDDFIDSYRTVQIEGEWMYLTFMKMPKQHGVWIKWRDGEKIILNTSISV